MATKSLGQTPPLIAIVGPTASGKTALAIRLANRLGGEIICADSRTIYKGLDVGTAKPTHEEQSVVPHWGIDLVEPGEYFTVADFKEYASQKIREIRGRGNIPFLVGGTGLYVDSVIFDFSFASKSDGDLREDLDCKTIQELQEYCKNNNIKMPENYQNKRYLIRAIEQNNISSKRRDSPIANTIVVGIATDKQILRTRIRFRSEQIFSNTVVQEATLLGKKYGWDNEAMTGNLYPLIRQMLDGEIDENELKQKFVTSDWRLAKRQMTWLRRNPYIAWGTIQSSEHYLSQILAQ